ncbi:hypothetical protein N7447_010803 [Penicillium robsamsonii]|uniref:uncharacterized protein n=1 Tax=Penicillium robsamsonii TaxID=1792511 RepID=UPI0025468958|nr:uncharacterized protein N7447_010803 [Penicillium robsamsonii]KAJ5807347.1 hypothetical protein N7447_010803 [Penicillium robsamsonii]
MPEGTLRRGPMSKGGLSYMYEHMLTCKVDVLWRLGIYTAYAYNKFGFKGVETSQCGKTTANHKCGHPSRYGCVTY